MAVDSNKYEEEKERLHRTGVVDALMDCLALLVRDCRGCAAMQGIIQYWVAETRSDGAAAADGEAAPLREGRLEGYAACEEWIGQGLDREALVARILQRVFALWPRDAADYQRGYDAFLEKELENPRAPYYSSSRVWITAVDDLRTKVACAAAQRLTPSSKLERRAVKLLHMHPERLAAANTAANTAAAHAGMGQPNARKLPSHWPASPFGVGSGAASD